MIKKLTERKIHFIILAFLIGLFLGINLSITLSADEPAHKYLDYFHQVYQLIITDYVDMPETKDIFYGAIKGMITSLNDPFSRFLDEKSYRELEEETSGEYVGIGIEITVQDGNIVVISPIEDTPAMKAGIVSGDIIIKVNDTPIKDKSLAEIVKMIRGMANTKVRLHVMREGFSEPLEFELVRVPVRIKSVSYAIIEGSIGYLKIKIFSSETGRDIEKAINYFNNKNIDRLIIDLRWNPGGLLDRAISISDLFLDKGKVIVSTRGREGSGLVKEFTSIKSPLYKGKLIVLINNGSASASEIFSGAIKDNNRGKLLGVKSFGKGSVQKRFNLNDKLGIMLTIAKYYTPSGASIHGKGIVPDYVVPMTIFLDKDKKNVNTIIQEKLTEKFVKVNKEYNEETKKKFLQLLKNKNLSISEKSAHYILKREINKYTKRQIYDLEFDIQLNKAIEIIKKDN
jgi:carboxyl-terminal processing protease